MDAQADLRLFCSHTGMAQTGSLLGGARWLSGRVSDSGARGQGFETYRHRVVSLNRFSNDVAQIILIFILADRMFPAWFKSLTVVHLLMGYIYMASGFIVSFLLLIGMVIWPFNKNLYRKYAFYLTYAQWSRKFRCFYFI